MKKVTNYLFLVSLMILLTNCQSKKYIQEVISDKSIGISFPFEERDYEAGFLTLCIPAEFELSLNPKKVSGTTFYYIKDNKNMINNHFVIYNGETDKHIYKKEHWEDGKYYPKTIYLVDRTFYISKKSAYTLLKKYHSNASLEEIKNNMDTIKLVPYSQFRKDFPAFIEEMRKEPDSLKIVISIKGRKENIVVKERINW